MEPRVYSGKLLVFTHVRKGRDTSLSRWNQHLGCKRWSCYDITRGSLSQTTITNHISRVKGGLDISQGFTSMAQILLLESNGKENFT